MRSLLSAAMIVVFWASGMLAQDNAGREPANLAGKWELTLESPHGALQFALHVKQEGSKISGTAEREGKAHPLTGSVQRNQILFSFEPRPDTPVAFKGTVDDDKMNGTAGTKDGRGPHGGAHAGVPWKAIRRQ